MLAADPSGSIAVLRYPYKLRRVLIKNRVLKFDVLRLDVFILLSETIVLSEAIVLRVVEGI